MAIATRNGVAWAGIATLNGVAKASVQTINGVSAAGGGGNTFGVQLAGPAPTTSVGATIASTFGGSTPIGSLSVAFVTQTWGGNEPRAITHVRDDIDGANNYELKAEVNNGGSVYVHIYTRVATAAGTRTVTCTFTGGSADAAIAVMSYSATAGFTADVTSTNTGTGTSITPGSVSPTGSALYLVASVWSNGNWAVLTPTASWTQRQELENTASSLIAVQDRFTTGAQNPAMTLDQSLAWACAAVTYH